MGNANERATLVHGNTQLFGQLPPQSCAHGLVGLDLATGKLPPTTLMAVQRASCHEYAALFITDNANGDTQWYRVSSDTRH